MKRDNERLHERLHIGDRHGVFRVEREITYSQDGGNPALNEISASISRQAARATGIAPRLRNVDDAAVRLKLSWIKVPRRSDSEKYADAAACV